MFVTKPLFIAFEGLDGSGQSTQVDLLSQRMGGVKACVVTKEPTNHIVGGIIRGQLMHDWTSTPECMQLLFAADRAHHLERIIEPALKKGLHVISDRYMFSSIAYGSVNTDTEWLKAINSTFRYPDKTIFIDVPPEVCVERMVKSRFEFELYEKLEYLKIVYENYKKLAKEHDTIFTVDGNDYKEKVHMKIVEALGL